MQVRTQYEFYNGGIDNDHEQTLWICIEAKMMPRSMVTKCKQEQNVFGSNFRNCSRPFDGKNLCDNEAQLVRKVKRILASDNL